MKAKKGFTLVELMVVVLIVAILAAVAIPILRGRIDAAKWAEGKAMMGTIATAIRAYHAEVGPTGTAPTAIVGSGNTELGFLASDLTGTYFDSSDFSLTVSSMDPLTYTITATNSDLNPGTVTLNQAGTWN
jgi:prepilin-type N-terminal cleavage/methylation domain-containing protein